MRLSKVIEQFGYSQHEARVYLAVLARGESMISELAGLLKYPRTSVQLMVEKLHTDGLLNVVIRKRYKYWVAENPERLLVSLKEKEVALREVMPVLSALRRGDGEKPTIKVFRGLEEIKLIHDDIIATKHAVSAIIPWDEWVDLLSPEYVQGFVERRRASYLRMRLIVPESRTSRVLQRRDILDMRTTRLLPKGIHIRTPQFIYGGKVAIISLNRKEPTGMLINDDAVRDTQSVFFETLWNQSTLR